MKEPNTGSFLMRKRRMNMAKKKDTKGKEPAKAPPPIKYEDTRAFDAFDRMMRSNRGLRGPM